MKTKVLITLEGGIIQHISTNNDDIQIVIMDYDGDAEETLSPQNYKPDTTFDEKSHMFYSEMNLTAEEEKTIRMFLKSINF